MFFLLYVWLLLVSYLVLWTVAMGRDRNGGQHIYNIYTFFQPQFLHHLCHIQENPISQS